MKRLTLIIIASITAAFVGGIYVGYQEGVKHGVIKIVDKPIHDTTIVRDIIIVCRPEKSKLINKLP